MRTGEQSGTECGCQAEVWVPVLVCAFCLPVHFHRCVPTCVYLQLHLCMCHVMFMDVYLLQHICIPSQTHSKWFVYGVLAGLDVPSCS